MDIREAGDDDLDQILQWVAVRHSRSAYSQIPFSPRRSALLAARLIRSDDGLVLIARRHGRRVAMLGAEAIESQFMAARVACLWTLYADAGSEACAVPLIRRYADWARDRGAMLVEANNSASMDDERFMKLIGRFGFTRSGSHAHLEI